MTKIMIKESDIRRYVRSLIREAIEAEAAADPADLAEREKMMSGQPYDRSKFPNGGKSIAMERQRRKELGLPPLRRPAGGVVPRLIGADGTDLTPANSPEKLQAFLDQKPEMTKKKDRERKQGVYIKKGEKEEIARRRGLSDEEAKNLKYDHSIHNLKDDPFTQKMLAMSPEERAEEAERIRRKSIEQRMQQNAEISKQISDLGRRGLSYPTKAELEQRIIDLKAKQEDLGPRCQANEYMWKHYDYIIKDTQKIIDKYYNKKDVSSSSDAADEIVNDALNDINNDSRFSEHGATELGDEYVDSSNVATNLSTQAPEEYNDEPLDDEESLDDEDDDSDSKDTLDSEDYYSKNRFKNAKNMGYFDDDDDDDDSFVF